MRLPVKFTRVKPPASGQVTLGADTVPNAASPGGAATPPTPSSMSHLFTARFTSASGWPVHRLAVAYKYLGAGPAIDLTASVYVYDAESEHWYQIGSATTLPVDKITFFDVVSLSDGSQTQSEILKPTAGSIEALVIVTDPGAAPNGTYLFSVGGDLSTFA